MAPKMGQPMEFKRKSSNFYETSGNTHFLETLNPYFHCENWLFQLKFFEGVSLPGVEYLPVLTGLFYLLVLLFMINISEALLTEIKT